MGKKISSKDIINNQPPKRLLVMGLSPNPGGIESVVINYVKYMLKEGFLIDFVSCSGGTSRDAELIALGCNIICVDRLSKAPLQHILRMFKIIDRRKYDVVWDNRDSLNNCLVLLISRIRKIPVRIIHGHTAANMGSKIKGLFHNLSKYFLIGHIANCYWAASPETMKYFFSSKKLREKSVIIPNCIDYNLFDYDNVKRKNIRKNLGIHENEKVIVVVGTLCYPKNQELIIRALYTLQKKDKNWKLILIGSGSDEQILRSLVNELNLNENVLFLGTRKRVDDVLQGADVFAMPSFHEGLGMAFLEAQVSGLPCVVSDTIPKSAYICNNCECRSPYASPEIWASAINDSYGKRKKVEFINDGYEKFNINVKAKMIINLLKKDY